MTMPMVSIIWLPRAQVLCAFLAWAVISLGGATAVAQEDAAAADETAAVAPATPLSADEIRKLVAPVALYPDDLLALVLPASTNPLQIVQAKRFLDKQAQGAWQERHDWRAEFALD